MNLQKWFDKKKMRRLFLDFLQMCPWQNFMLSKKFDECDVFACFYRKVENVAGGVSDEVWYR